ncbi:MAG TPA: glutamine synthetase family protein [Actinomycetota bacterium]|nr:glutamine synthetase family protein [Actinomycetota bacterium]
MAKKRDRPADPVQRERARVLDACERLGLDLVRFLYVDHGGVVRGKATSRARLEERLATGIGLTVAMQAMSMLDELAPVDGLGPVGEVRLVPDTASFVPLPWAPGAGAMVADLVRLDGEPWEACPRAFLKRAVDELATEGYELLAAFEPELTLGRRQPGERPGDPAPLVPLDESLCFSTTGFGLAHGYAIELVRALQAQGLTVEQYYPELGHGQQELSIRHAPALRAADNQVWYRETARGVAWHQGLWASLAPKPVPDQAGNGAHLHASLWAGGRNAFWDAGDARGLSETAYHWIGGLLAHLPGLVALTCGSVNSYRRLVPQTWSSAFVCWGMDNREAAVRVPSRMWGLDEASTNLELKPSDSTGNPYLALGAYIHAGLDGLRNRLDPGRPVDVDPAGLSRASRSRRGIRRLPESLAAALDALEADELLMEALGPLRRTAYLAVKRSEAAAFAAHDAAFECAQHAARF